MLRLTTTSLAVSLLGAASLLLAVYYAPVNATTLVSGSTAALWCALAICIIGLGLIGLGEAGWRCCCTRL
jgi:hypothetical protein